MRHSAKSHIGLQRDNNEDAHACAPELGLFIVADGIGGLARGEVASRMAADQLLAGIIARCDPTFGASTSPYGDILRDAIAKVQEHVRAENDDNRDKVPMGTTLVAVLIADGTTHFANVGDSRLYAVSRSGEIEQVTKDQTLAQRKIDRGEDAEEATRLHGHIVTNYIGTASPFLPEIGARSLAAGDTMLLCTDGLTDMVQDDVIAKIVNGHASDVDAAASELIERANEHGGRDNITVVVIQPDN